MDDLRASALAEPGIASERNLKDELYSLVKADSEIFEFLQAGSLDGIWYLNLEHPGVGWMSERYKNLFGYEDHEIPNNSLWWRGNIFAEDLPATLENFAQHCADPKVPFDQILRHRHKNGSAVWVRCRGYAIRDASGKPIRVLGAHTDITAFKQTEQELRALYEASINGEASTASLASGILMADQHGLIRATNSVADSIFGYQNGELCGKPLAGLLAQSPEAERQGLRKDGSVFPIQWELSTIQLAENVFQTASVADLTARKGMETALRESERRFRQLTESLPQLVWTCTPNGTCDYLSPQWTEYTGVPEADQLELGWVHQVHPDDRTELMARWTTSVKDAKPYQCEFRIRRNDGCYRWFDARGIPLRNSEFQVVKWFGTCTDITERKHVESDQRFLIQLTVHLQAAASVDAIAVNMTRVMANYFEADRCILYAISADQDHLKLLYEFSRQDYPAQSAALPLNAWGSEELKSRLARGEAVAVDNTASHPYTAANYHTTFHPAGMEAFLVAPMRRYSQLVYVLCLFARQPRVWSQREIHLAQTATERIWLGYETLRAIGAERAMHETLAASEQRLQLAMRAGAIGIWESDPIAKTNTWDAYSRSIFGFPPDLVINSETVTSCIHPDDRDAVQQSVQSRHDAPGSGRFELDYRIFPWNGASIRHVYAQGQWFYEGEGEKRRPVRAIGTVQDVSALKRGEQALRRANLELEQFAYAAAHDLQEPLRNVGLATQVLASRYRGKFDSDADNLLKTAVEGPLRMQAMVKDLLAYSQAVMVEEGTVLSADPNAVLAIVLSNLSALIEEKQAQISCEILPSLRMSETHLVQLLQNLISNSVKYSGDRQPQIQIAATRRSGECVFFVKDNGIGIAPEHHQRAFGVFKRLHTRNVPGTGIGLALCKRIVEHYGGRIWIESDGLDGTSVLFTPPLAE